MFHFWMYISLPLPPPSLPPLAPWYHYHPHHHQQNHGHHSRGCFFRSRSRGFINIGVRQMLGGRLVPLVHPHQLPSFYLPISLFTTLLSSFFKKCYHRHIKIFQLITYCMPSPLFAFCPWNILLLFCYYMPLLSILLSAWFFLCNSPKIGEAFNLIMVHLRDTDSTFSGPKSTFSHTFRQFFTHIIFPCPVSISSPNFSCHIIVGLHLLLYSSEVSTYTPTVGQVSTSIMVHHSIFLSTSSPTSW